MHSAGASAVIYGGLDEAGIVFDGVPGLASARRGSASVRQAGKLSEAPHGRGLGHGGYVEQARERARTAAALVRPQTGKEA